MPQLALTGRQSAANLAQRLGAAQYIVQLVICIINACFPLPRLGWAAWCSLVASMMRWKWSGPLVQVNGVGFWLSCFKYRSRSSCKSFFDRCTLWVSACLVRMLKKHLIIFIQEAWVGV